MKEHVMSYFDGMSQTTEMKKLTCGPLVKTILDNMKPKDDQTNPRKIYLYSGHELNIAAFTRAHDIKEFRYPDFGNALVIEKLRDTTNNQIYVRVNKINSHGTKPIFFVFVYNKHSLRSHS